MLYKRILPALLILTLAVYFIARYKGPEPGVLTTIDKSNLEEYWRTKDVNVANGQFLLAKNSASITSRFRLRDFEINFKMKTTKGAVGMLNFATSKNYDPKNFRGYSVLSTTVIIVPGKAKRQVV